MDENEKSSCKCNQESNNIQFIGGIIVYELAVIIFLLVFVLWDIDKPYEQPSNAIEQTTEKS
jgi:hypothetical protein